MVFYSLKVGKYDLKYSPFSDNDEQYPICDKDGEVLDYVKGTRTNGYYVKPNTEEKVTQTFMLINGKAKEKFTRTKETNHFKIVEENECEDLVNPKQYIVECDNLLTELKATKKCLKFGISFGGFSKPYFAIISVNKLYNRLEMNISKGFKSQQYADYSKQLEDKKAVEEITLTISGIDKVKIEELITLWKENIVKNKKRKTE